MGSLRWGYKFGSWHPMASQWVLAGQCVQPEEKTRISKFVFKKDAKSAMAGRLLLRKAVSDSLGFGYSDVKLARTQKGKPYLTNNVPPQYQHFNFNVSHQGDYAVLAAEPCHLVGIDVMKVENPRSPGGQTGFFKTMNRQFTNSEWATIQGTSDQTEQLTRFYRYWCLKESYVKALGTGIGFELQRLSFHTPTLTLTPGVTTTDTEVYVDGNIERCWRFEETMLDDKHCIAVALQFRKAGVVVDKATDLPDTDIPPPSYRILDFDSLMEGAQPLIEPDDTFLQNFEAKMERPGGHKHDS